MIIPALDESAAIGGVVAAALRTGVSSVTVVDNGSTDETAEVARHAGARVVVEGERGYGAACLAGLHALEALADRGRDDVIAKGEGLGPVGARFVAEVIIGLLELDARSFLGSNRNWSPMDDKIGAGVMSLYQLLTA